MPNNWKPRRFGEHAAHQHLRRMMDSDLYTGDILLVKEWENDGFKGDVTFIRATQAVFSHVRGGSSNTEHVLLNCTDGGVYVIESAGSGVKINNSVRHRDHVVYSCTNDTLRKEACLVAKALAGEKHIPVFGVDADDTRALANAKKFASYAAHESPIKYRSMRGMAASVFRRKGQGHFADARLKKLHDIVYNDSPATGIRMICSEFAASCYEVAALKIEQDTGINPLPFGKGVDPRAMTAKSFEAVLRRSPLFQMAGSYTGTQLVDPNLRDVIRKMAILYKQLETKAGRHLSVDEAFDYMKADRPTWVQNKNDFGEKLENWRSMIAQAYDLRILNFNRP